MKIIDVSLPLKNKMWSYKDEWKNELSILSSTLESDLSTVYRFNICSHTGTYIETSQHKLRNNILLDQFDLTRFFCDVKVVVITLKIGHKCIFLDDFLFELKNNSLSLENGDSLIISCGWSNSHHEDKDFVIDAPFFDEKLTEYLMEQKLNLLGVDTPVIDNQKKNYFPINKLFESNNDLLILAPLLINDKVVSTGRYVLNCLPLKIKNVSASPCRPVLLKK